jgi:hypothetical protein
MTVPGTEEVIEELESDLPDGYLQKLESSANYVSSGIAAVAAYAEGGGRRHLGEAYRIGSLIGVNTRVVDDLMDGDGVSQVEDREAFLNNYILSIEGDEVEPVEQESERAAYRVGEILGEELDPEVMASYIRDVRDIAVEEDKSTIEGYRSYSRGISATIGEIVGMGLGELDDFDPTTENLNFAYDLAYLGQVADDRMDADTGLDEEEMDEFYHESIERMKRHGLKGDIIGKTASIYPQIYGAMRKASDLNS